MRLPDSEEKRSKSMSEPRFTIGFTVAEFLSIRAMLVLGKMFTSPEDKKRVQTVLERVGKKWRKEGMPAETVKKIVEL
jgi:chorismate mutase